MEDFDYPGIRLHMVGTIEKLRQPIKIDISTDDVITPRAIEYEYKLMFEERTILLNTYNIETLLAEKAQTIISRGLANTRMRDFYDLHEITGNKEFSWSIASDAFKATCRKRKTEFSNERIEDELKNITYSKVTWQELNLEQEYIEYENKASLHAYRVYDGIKARCGDTAGKQYNNIHACYDKSAMWQVWRDDPKSFVKWYLEHYYECDDESMAVDKDLFGDGSGMYHPDFCCILPQGLNTLLTNCKKHYKEGESPENTLPLGVRYNSQTNKYYGEITFTGTDRTIKLSERDTADDAFAEYKIMKQADILMMVARYKESIPDYIYDRFLKVEVKPY